MTGVPTGGSVVVNIAYRGAVTLQISNVDLDGIPSAGSTGTAAPLADATVFNFSAANALTLTGTWAGTLYAPGAAVTFSSGHVWGTVVGRTLSGANESTYGPLDTALCADIGPSGQLPEGPPLLIGLARVGVIGGVVLAARRRSRRRPV